MASKLELTFADNFMYWTLIRHLVQFVVGDMVPGLLDVKHDSVAYSGKYVKLVGEFTC